MKTTRGLEATCIVEGTEHGPSQSPTIPHLSHTHTTHHTDVFCGTHTCSTNGRLARLALTSFAWPCRGIAWPGPSWKGGREHRGAEAANALLWTHLWRLMVRTMFFLCLQFYVFSNLFFMLIRFQAEPPRTWSGKSQELRIVTS